MQKHYYVTVIRVESTVEADEGFQHVPGATEIAQALVGALGTGSKTMSVEREGKGTALVGYRVDDVRANRSSREPS